MQVTGLTLKIYQKSLYSENLKNVMKYVEIQS